MAWGAAYETPEEQAAADAHRDAQAAAAQRARMSPFERTLLDALADIAGSLETLAKNSAPFYQLDCQTGELKVLHGDANTISHLLATAANAGPGKTRTTDGVVGGTSAEPVADPGSARPENHAGRYSSQEHCGQLHEDEIGGFHECYQPTTDGTHRCLCGLTWPADVSPNPS